MNIHIQRAIDVTGGTQTGLAKKIGGKTRQGHVYQWLNELRRPSPQFAKKIEIATDGKVPASMFYPELFDAPRPTQQQDATA